MTGWIFYTKETEAITKKALGGLSIPEKQLRLVDADEVVFLIDNNLRPAFQIGGELVDPPDFALSGIGLSAYTFSLLRQLEMVGTILLNPLSVIEATRDKITTNQILANANIPIAKTVPLNRSVTAEMLDKYLGFPLIVKPTSEYGGKGVELIQNPDEYKLYATEHQKDISEGVLLAQEFIATSKGKDLRVFMIGDKPIYAYIRKAGNPEEFRSNISTGGSAVPFELTDELTALSKKVVKAINSSIAGIDYLFTDDGVVVGEVNSVPGISGFPNPQVAVKALLAYVAEQMMTRPSPKWKVEACFEAAKKMPLAQKLNALEKFEFPAVQRSLFGRCEKVQQTVLMEILNRCKDTEFGKAHNFSSMKSVSDYLQNMPLTDWSDYEDYVKRMEAGEANLLFPGQAKAFYLTSGTSGAAKSIPESIEAQEARKLILSARQFVLFNMIRNNMGKVVVFSNAPVVSVTSGGIPCGSASGITVNILPSESAQLIAYPVSIGKFYSGDQLNYMLLRCALPEENIVAVAGNNAARLNGISEYAIEHGEQLINDIKMGTCSLPIPDEISAEVEPFLTANPERAEFLKKLLAEEKFIPKFYWPRLTLACFWLGGSVGMYVKEAAAILPESTLFVDVGYGSSEIKVNIPMKPGTPAGALATYCGFYEFLPEDGGQPVLAHQLEDGKRYELVVTTYAGLYRYRMHDIVQVDGFTGNTPNIYFVTKSGDIGSIAQEKLYGTAFANSMRTGLSKLGSELVQAQAYTDMENKRYIACIELSEPLDLDVNALAQALEKELCETNFAYNAVRESILKPMALNIMKSGWKDFLYQKYGKGTTSITQVKLPIIITSPPDSQWIELSSDMSI